MADQQLSFRDLLNRQQTAGFVGREGAVAGFDANLAVTLEDSRRRMIFVVHGDGGVGKTHLVLRLRGIADRHQVPTAYLNEFSVITVPDVMHQIATQLARQGLSLKRFTRLHDKYRQR